MMPAFISSSLREYQEKGFNTNCAGAVQYIQKTGWSQGINRMDWRDPEDWGNDLYARLANVQHFYNRSVELEYEFHQGVGLVWRAFQFGLLTDGYGDVPYSEALSPVDGGTNLFPVFDRQEEVYKGIIDELKEANDLFSKNIMQYNGIPPNTAQDLLYGYDPGQWRKLSNSLRLRYYMRLSEKLPDYAKSGIQEIINDLTNHPIFESNDDDAIMSYLGTANSTSWAGNLTFDNSATPNWNSIILCAGLRDVLVDFEDPRLPLWFQKVAIRIAIDKSASARRDDTRGGVRYLSQNWCDFEGEVDDEDTGEPLFDEDTGEPVVKKPYVVYNKDTWVDDNKAGKILIDTTDYVGMPLAFSSGNGVEYNLNPNATQGSRNPHASQLALMYQEATGPFLKARMITYAEICFILAEAAQKGWISGAQDWYEKGVEASLTYWGLGDEYDAYIQNAGVAFNSANALEQIITQKWIANWNIAVESWCDWRRTGLPHFSIGQGCTRNTIPIRYRYSSNESSRNLANYEAAVNNLEATSASGPEGTDSAWSKIWLLQ